MRVLIDAGHPAHVHYYKHLAWLLLDKGNKVLFTCREKEMTLHLLKIYGFEYISMGSPYHTRLGKLMGMFLFDLKMLRISKRFKADLYLSAGSMYAAQCAWLRGKPHISLEDTGNMEQIRLYAPFSKAIITPVSLQLDLGKKQIRINSFLELAYLHPNRFKPDYNIKKYLGLKDSEEFVLLRFVSWGATHDYGHRGIDSSIKRRLIELLQSKYTVFISSESQLPEDLRPMQIKISPEKIHDVLIAASLYIGEGATMASECAMLGTPAIYINPLYAGTINEQEKHGLVYHLDSDKNLLEFTGDFIKKGNLKSKFRQLRKKMLAELTDPTEFMIKYIEETSSNSSSR